MPDTATPIPKGPNDDLPVISDWRTKSFWMIAIIPGAMVISNLLGFNLLEIFGVTNEADLADKVYMIVMLILGIAGLIARAAPQARLKILGQIAGATSYGPEVKSPALVGLLAVGIALVLAGCTGMQGLTAEQQYCLAGEGVRIASRDPAYADLAPVDRATAASNACGVDPTTLVIDAINTAIVAAQKAS